MNSWASRAFGFLLVIFVVYPTLVVIVLLAMQSWTDCHYSKDGCTFVLVGTTFVLKSAEYLDAHGEAITSLATLWLALFTFTLWRATNRLTLLAEDQGKAMSASIAESARAAAAMERVADGTQANGQWMLDRTAQQMRAYLSTQVGGAIFQDSTAAPPLRFEGRLALVNVGQTPAKRVLIQKRAAVAPHPLPRDFDFALPALSADDGGVTLGAGQQIMISAVVDNFVVPEARVEDVKNGVDRALYMWGRATYFDIFDHEHETTFCLLFVWTRGGDQVNGYYAPQHNSSS
jgi:hypothetical protein